MANDQTESFFGNEKTSRTFVQSIKELILANKLIFLLAGIGCLFLITSILLLVKTTLPTSDIEFSTDNIDIASTSAMLSVDVEGAVMKPGVYNLPGKSRIQDALIAAGGLSSDADREWVARVLNRAALLTDGAKIFIPQAVNNKEQLTNNKQQITNNTLGAQNNLININSGSSAELDTLPGVGPANAEKIISGRPYGSVEELKSKKIVNSSVYDKIKDLVSVW